MRPVTKEPMRLIHAVFLLALLVPVAALAGPPGEVTLYAAPALRESGLLRHALPRFKLKTQIPVRLVDSPDAAQLLFVGDGAAPPLIEGPGGIYGARLTGAAPADGPAARLLDWLYSEIGQRTLAAFRKDGAPVFTVVYRAATPEEAPLPEGDAALGEKVAYRNCGRCHVVGPGNRMAGIGSTPSFGVLRALPDWRERFSTYYTRPPHPGFTQITGVTPPFEESHPPAIEPLALSLEAFEALLAYVASVPAADLGAPLRTR